MREENMGMRTSRILGIFLALFLSIAALWTWSTAKGAEHEIQAILIFMCSLIVAGIEKVIAAIKESRCR